MAYRTIPGIGAADASDVVACLPFGTRTGDITTAGKLILNLQHAVAYSDCRYEAKRSLNRAPGRRPRSLSTAW